MKKKIKNLFKIIMIFILGFIKPVYAANDPLAVINNLSDLLFSIVEGVGGILLVFSIVQFGLSFKSHDPSQRSNSIMGIVGAVIIISARIIIGRITG